MTPDEQLNQLRIDHARLEGRVQALEAAMDDIKDDLRSLSKTVGEIKSLVAASRAWQGIYSGLLALVLGGLVAAGYELLRR